MQGWTRRAAAAALLAGAAAALPGCMVAVGSTTGAGHTDRIKVLENRVRAAEERLGIPAPDEAAK